VTPGRERLFSRATNALHEAEALAQLGEVVGISDAPPANPAAEPHWIEDWADRASAALEKARVWASTRRKVLKDRAAAIAARVKSGVESLWRASGAARASEKLKAVAENSAGAFAGLYGAGFLVTAVIAYIAFKVWMKNG
jgi:hypothetical protein